MTIEATGTCMDLEADQSRRTRAAREQARQEGLSEEQATSREGVATMLVEDSTATGCVMYPSSARSGQSGAPFDNFKRIEPTSSFLKKYRRVDEANSQRY